MAFTRFKNFTYFPKTIGIIPTSYKESLTYEEQLLYICNFIEKEVIPSLNENAEVNKELQEKFVQLVQDINEEFEKLSSDFSEQIQEQVDRLFEEAIESGQIQVDFSNYYTKTEIDSLLNTKANSSDVYTKTETNGLLEIKANSNDVFTKTETEDLLSVKANNNDVYTKTETEDLLSGKVNNQDLSNYYTKTEEDSLLLNKVNVSDMENYYTKAEIDEGKSNNFSTQEKIIGSWINGKPIYQKTYQWNASSSTSQIQNVTIADEPNVDLCINAFGFYSYTSSPNTTRILGASNSESNVELTRFYCSGKGNFRIQTNKCDPCNGYVTVQYTKISD